ncbi:MAG: Mth938-like domain-containing protein [Pseudomonadota bacterium]
MRLNEVSFTGPPPIDGYGPGFFRIAGEVLHGPRLIGPEVNLEWDGVSAAQALALAGRVDLVLLGLGAEITAPPAELLEELEAAGLAVEFMATPPACRTYNVLLGEGRRIGAALLPVT